MTDEELIAFAREFREGILNGRSSEGMCAAVCWPLVVLLNLYGVQCESVETDLSDRDDCEPGNHVWIRLSDGRVLDPTADQFGEVDIYLGEPLVIHSLTQPSGRGHGGADGE